MHVHLGQALGRPVKIPAARTLTLPAVLEHCRRRKGLGMVGIVDAATSGGLEELRRLLRGGELRALEGGGFRYEEAVTLIAGAEVETADEGCRSHWLGFFGRLQALEGFAARLWRVVSNPQFSTPRAAWRARDFVEAVTETGGLALPAHAFTPHRGVYGSCADRLAALLPPPALARVAAIELGLSADSEMADHLSELRRLSFLSNSDAHSLDKIAREHNLFELGEPSFDELARALRAEGGRRVAANFGLDPRLGKYHRTACNRCGEVAAAPPPVRRCPGCGSADVTKGVRDRLAEIADASPGPSGRAPYVHQLPLEYLPGIGRKTRERLYGAFGSELAILHQAPAEELRRAVGGKVAEVIILARQGRLAVIPGGGGVYGRVEYALSTGHRID